MDSNYILGNAQVYLSKEAATPVVTHALAGELYLADSGWVMLRVPASLVRGAFDALHEIGVELPLHDGRLNAHVSVMRPDELAKAGGPDKITELGHTFHYNLGRLRTVVPTGWSEMSRVWFFEVVSPELEKLRRSYGLSAQPDDGKKRFHVTVATRRKNVLRENDVSKAAAIRANKLPVKLHEQTKAHTCGPATLKMVEEYLGKHTTESRLATGAGTTAADGTPPGRLAEQARKDGFKAKIKEHATPDILRALVDENKTPIVNFQLDGKPEGEDNGHYSVVAGYEGETFHLKDPAEGEKTIHATELDKRWHDVEAGGAKTDHLAIVVNKTGSAKEKTVAVDLDGTLAENDGWKGSDYVGKMRPGALKAMKRFKAKGYVIIVHTCRNELEPVRKWLEENKIPFDHINKNPNQPASAGKKKIMATCYVDDKAVHARQSWSEIESQVHEVMKSAKIRVPEILAGI